MMRKDLALRPESAGIAIIDIQEKLAAAMPEERLITLLRSTHLLLQTARRLGLAVVVSEQYPKGLGPTVAVLTEELVKFPRGHVGRVEKVEFDCTAVDAWTKHVEVTGKTQWIVVGMETHICVYQTVRGMIDRDLVPHVMTDAVTSRTEENRSVGLSLCQQSGAVISSSETALYDLLKQAGTDDFRWFRGHAPPG